MLDTVVEASGYVATIADLMDVGRALLVLLTMLGVARVGVGYVPRWLRQPAPKAACRRCGRRRKHHRR